MTTPIPTQWTIPTNPLIYKNEPYSPDLYAEEFLKEYLQGLNYLRLDFLKTKNMDLYYLLQELLPVGIYADRYPDLVDESEKI